MLLLQALRMLLAAGPTTAAPRTRMPTENSLTGAILYSVQHKGSNGRIIVADTLHADLPNSLGAGNAVIVFGSGYRSLRDGIQDDQNGNC